MTRKAPPANWLTIGMDAWALAAESNMVIAQRIGAMAFGGPAAAKEAERMVAEKSRREYGFGYRLGDRKIRDQPGKNHERQHCALFPPRNREPKAAGEVTGKSARRVAAFRRSKPSLVEAGVTGGQPAD